MDAPSWIEKPLAIAIHRHQLAEHGGRDGVRDEGPLDSALARPRHLFACSDPTTGIPTLAAAYAFGIAKNHAFIDGNKRTAYVVCRTFLILNGYDFAVDRVARYEMVMKLAAGEMQQEELETWMRMSTRAIEV
jgi:death on curing protein